MSAEKKDQLMFIVTAAEEKPDHCTIPFVLANAAFAMDAQAHIVLQATAVYLAMKGYARHVHAGGLPPLSELLDAYIEAGGKLLVCSPCIQARMIAPEDLIEGAEVVAAATLIDLMLEVKNVVTY